MVIGAINMHAKRTAKWLENCLAGSFALIAIMNPVSAEAAACTALNISNCVASGTLSITVPPVPTTFVLTNPTQGTLSWTASTSVLSTASGWENGKQTTTQKAYSQQPSNLMTTTPSITLTNLIPGTTYDVVVSSMDLTANTVVAPTAPAYLSFTVPPLSQTITFGALSNQLVGAAPFTVSATASSGQPVSLTSSPTTVCTVSGSTVTVAGAGICTITATQAGTTSYTAATPVTQSFSVYTINTNIGAVSVTPADTVTGKGVATITFSNVTAAGATVVTSGIAAPATPSFQTTCTPTIALDISTTATFTGSATVCVNPTLLGSSCTAGASLWHYMGGAWVKLTAPTNPPAGQICGLTTSFSPFAVFAPAPPSAQTITFGSAPSVSVGSSGVVTATGGASGNPVTFSAAPASVCTISSANGVNTVTGKATGICTITASQAGNANYLPAPTVTQILSVTAATTTGNNDGDVPLPPWAYVLLAAGLLGAMSRHQRTN